MDPIDAPGDSRLLRRPPAAGGLALPLAAAAGLLLGIQLLRSFLGLATFYLIDAAGLSPLETAAISLAVLASGLLAPRLARRFGWRRTLRWTAGLLAALRAAEQLCDDAAADAALTLAGSALLALLLPLLLLTPRGSGALRGRLALLAVAALAFETALRTISRTLDLSWQRAVTADLVVLASCAACLVAVARAGSAGPDDSAPLSARRWGWLALGAALALYLLVFSNPAQLAARAGLPLERAAWLVLCSWLCGLLVVALLPLHGAVRWRALEASALAAVGGWMAVFAGEDAWFGLLLGTTGLCVLLFDLLAGDSATAVRGGAAGGPAAGAAAPVALLLLYLVYGRFDQAYGAPETLVYGLAIGLLVGPCLLLAWRARQEPAAAAWRAWPAILALAAVVALVGWRELEPPAAPHERRTAGPIRVMTYNLHQGFDVSGRLDPEALARVIELERPDVLALQEVTRGWLVTGGLDLHSWLTRRLGMRGVFAGTADPQWGNAVLSRLPIVASRYHPLPPQTLPLRRGVLDVTVQTSRGALRVLCLHLHHRRSDDEIRTRQVRALLEIWAGTPGTLLLGDFNALPGSPAIELLREAGLRDASALLAATGRGTTTKLDGRQIDWIFATRDLAFESTSMRYSRASDHLPVATTIHLTTRFRGAAPPSAAAGRRRPPG